MTEPTESPSDRPSTSFSPLRLLRCLKPLQQYFPWPRPPRGSALDDAIRRTQLTILLREFGDGKGIGSYVGERDDEAYLYRTDRVLVRSEDLDDVRRFLAERSDRYGGRGDSVEVVPGLHHVVLPPKVSPPRLLDDLDRELRPDVARPDHVLYVTARGIGKLCPADEPRVPRRLEPVPPVSSNLGAGSDVRVSVVDTGWWEPAETTGLSDWLHDVDGEPDPVDQQDIQSYAGHGTFVSGIVRCLAPASRIQNEAILVRAGAAYESDIVRQLNDAVLTKFEPHLISISAGTYTRRDAGLLAFEVLWGAEHLREQTAAVLVVAAAGNDHTSRPFWPAAYDWVVGVGSLDADGTVSSFSNTGAWVDVYAQGRDLVNAFPAGTYRPKEPPSTGQPPRVFKGLARWSGTSFATPVVSGAIAAHMSSTGRSAREAADDLFANASRPLVDRSGNAIIGVGPPFA